MIYVGIDVAKNKHDCAAVGSDGNVVLSPFRIKNSLDGYTRLIQRIDDIVSDRNEVQIGLEDTGPYTVNIAGYLDNLFSVKVIDPLFTAKYKKSTTLRKTKTDSIDAIQIAKMLRIGTNFKPIKRIPYNCEELKSFVRYRAVLVKERSKTKTSIKRLIHILLPELEDMFSDLYCPTVLGFLYEYPGKAALSKCRTPALTKVLLKSSKGHYGEDMAFRLREAANNSIGIVSPAKSYVLKETIKHLYYLNEKVKGLEDTIAEVVHMFNPPILSIPGIGEVAAATIIGEIGDFNRFNNPDQILAFAGMSPTIYQSGKYASIKPMQVNRNSKMEKRGSHSLRSSIYIATRLVCMFDPNFREYLFKKKKEGKHHYVAISHAAKKLIRLMYALETEHRSYELRPNNKPKTNKL